VDKVYPTLDDDARQQLLLQLYLSQLQNDQVAFGVKQRKPKTIETAVAATVELELYLVIHSSPSAVAPVQVPVDHVGQRDVREMMAQLLTCMEKLEAGNMRQEERASGKKPLERSQSGDSVRNQRVVVCYVWSPFALCILQTIADHTTARNGTSTKLARYNSYLYLCGPTMPA